MFRARIFRGNSGPAQKVASRLDETQNFASRLDETTDFGRCVPSLLEGCLAENHSENFFRLRSYIGLGMNITHVSRGFVAHLCYIQGTHPRV